MTSSFDPRVLLGVSHSLPSGERVRLRLARFSDIRAIEELVERCGIGACAPDPAQLVRFDPRRRLVICATALIDQREVLVGLGGVDLDAATPDLLLADPQHAGLADLIERALVNRVRALGRARAA
jgi:hypothetical protein